MAEQTAVLFGVARLATSWLALSRAYLHRVQQMAVPHPRPVDIGADAGRCEPTREELWQRVIAAPVVGNVGHTLRYCGGTAHPDPSRRVPPWVTRRGVDVGVLQQVQLAHQLQAARDVPLLRRSRRAP